MQTLHSLSILIVFDQLFGIIFSCFFFSLLPAEVREKSSFSSSLEASKTDEHMQSPRDQRQRAISNMKLVCWPTSIWLLSIRNKCCIILNICRCVCSVTARECGMEQQERDRKKMSLEYIVWLVSISISYLCINKRFSTEIGVFHD